MRLFGKKKEIEEEMEDLDKFALGPDSTDETELSPEFTRLKETATAEAEKITEKFEEPKMLPEPVEEPKEIFSEPVGIKREVELEELPLKDLNEKIDEELKKIRKRMKDLGSLAKLSLESPEMVSLMELYTEYRDKVNRFVEELDNMDLRVSSSDRTFVAIYKFRACKELSEIKREIRKIEALCKQAGFVPTKIHEILESRAEDLIEVFLKQKSKNE